MRENRTSSSMRGHWKRATAQRACALLYEALPSYSLALSRTARAERVEAGQANSLKSGLTRGDWG